MMVYGIEPFYIFILIIGAICHASWNGIVKFVDDNDKRSVSILINSGVSIGMFLGSTFFLKDGFLSVFTRIDMILVALLSGFTHLLYWITLPQMYKKMDMSQAYPIARGVSPILVAVMAFYTVGDSLPFWGIVGVLIASFGVLLNAFPKRGSTFDVKTIFPAVLVGVIIASYTVIDGYGMRMSEEPLQFVVLYGLVETILAMILLLREKKNKSLNLKANAKLIVIGSLLNGLAYGLVLWMMVVVPFAYVSSIREMSAIFAVLIGIIVFREKAGLKRFLFALITVIGCIIIALGG